jgi:hypothetical protein
MGTAAPIDIDNAVVDGAPEMLRVQPLQPQQLAVVDAVEHAAVDLFGPVDQELDLDSVKKAIRGVSRPRDLRPLITKSTHDPLLNMLELAMKAKHEGADATAFERFAECLPYVWTKVTQAAMPGLPGGGPGVGEVTYRWATPGETA